jgi:hypothetical protein
VSKAFASQADLAEKKMTFEQLNAYLYTAERENEIRASLEG